MTFSKIAFDACINKGTCLSVSIQVELIVTNSPLELILFILNWKFLTIKTSLFLGVTIFNLILPLTSVFPVIFGSFINVFPFEDKGGKEPAVAILRLSITV